MIKSIFDISTAKEFFHLIPTDPHENLDFRIKLHQELAVDTKLQEIYFYLCREYLPIIFNTGFFTYNPQKRINAPFNLRPKQIEAVEILDHRIKNFEKDGKDIGINKNRKEGASEICIKTMVAHSLLYEYNNFILGSRKEDYVDHFGDPTTLFAKVDNALDCLPTWWRELVGYDKNKCRKNMVVEIPATSSSLIGETTNESFSAGSRATAILLDEFGRVEPSTSESIEASVHDVGLVLYSSTHFYGANHTFNKALKRPSTVNISLMWYDNPEENMGLYTTSEPGKYELLDKDYFSGKEVVILDNITQYNLDEKAIQIVADGLRGIDSPYRAPWFDRENFKRMGNKRDFACNVCGSPIGSADAPFDPGMLEEIQEKTIRPPDYEGELIDGQFIPDFGQKRLKWWGMLDGFGRPNQRHNFIIAIDPSYGLGSANSAVMIIDVNLLEQVGSFVDAYTKPEELADFVEELARWLGGVEEAFIIWECNGGCGTTFTDRLVESGYTNLYTQKREDSKTRKTVSKWGWRSNQKAKENVLGQLAVALNNGLLGKNEPRLIIHDELLLEELSDYIFKEGGGIIQSSKADLSTGAAERHGDRGIAIALCVLGLKEQNEGDYKNSIKPPYGSFEYWRRKHEEQKEMDKRKIRRFIF